MHKVEKLGIYTEPGDKVVHVAIMKVRYFGNSRSNRAMLAMIIACLTFANEALM